MTAITLGSIPAKILFKMYLAIDARLVEALDQLEGCIAQGLNCSASELYIVVLDLLARIDAIERGSY